MSNGRKFMLDLIEACKDQRWSVRAKDSGFIVSPPPALRRPGFETIHVFAPKDNHERKVLGQRLKSAGLPIRVVETEIVTHEDHAPMPQLDTVPPTARPKSQAVTVTAELDTPTIERIRRRVNQIADLCAEVVVELDKLEKEGEDVRKLKQLLKTLGD